ncbi:N-acetylmuramoyl-L-alanine amidase family protein [Psychroflexus aestuariivivens]|uniref:N-acetylmuramoyl-L-alanine amidase family protein n=1 Tax=Psychroflexus aestuariivivens TaxID=1795040 RepID=UPI000FDBDF55|nr:N-acetylmuramoyl-L-alanine amidase [Psychroflexus aestuariivivens]
MKKIAFIFSLCLMFSFAYAGECNPDKKLRIVIDAGHGGADNGSGAELVTEKEIVMDVSKQLKDLAVNRNIEIILLRESDEYLSLSERVEKIKTLKPDLVISLHANYSNNEEDRGVEVFVNKNDHLMKSTYYATKLLESFAQKDFKVRPVKAAGFFILENIDCPAVMLELGFLSNKEDLSYLNSEFGKKFLAKQIVASLDF